MRTIALPTAAGMLLAYSRTADSRLNAPGNTDQYYADVEAAATTIDTDTRTELVGDLQMHLFENVNMIPMYSELSFTAMNADLQGFNVLADGTAPLNDLSY